MVGTNDEDSIMSQTSSTCGYKESYSGILETMENGKSVEAKKSDNMITMLGYDTSSADYSLSDEGTPTMTVVNADETESLGSSPLTIKTYDENTFL